MTLVIGEENLSTEDFFGNLSPFQIIVAIVAFGAAIYSLITGSYSFHKTWIERAKISIYLGDALRISLSRDRHTPDFYLMCNLVNITPKVGTIHRFEAQISDPDGKPCNFVWNLFCKYNSGEESIEKDSDIFPVAVQSKDSRLLHVGFQSETTAIQSFKWIPGKYEFKVFGWVNKEHRGKPTNLKSSAYHIQITEEYCHQLSLAPQKPCYITIPVIEWQRQHR